MRKTKTPPQLCMAFKMAAILFLNIMTTPTTDHLPHSKSPSTFPTFDLLK